MASSLRAAGALGLVISLYAGETKCVLVGGVSTLMASTHPLLIEKACFSPRFCTLTHNERCQISFSGGFPVHSQQPFSNVPSSPTAVLRLGCSPAVYVEYKNEEDESYSAVCDVSERVSCSKVRQPPNDRRLYAKCLHPTAGPLRGGYSSRVGACIGTAVVSAMSPGARAVVVLTVMQQYTALVDDLRL